MVFGLALRRQGQKERRALDWSPGTGLSWTGVWVVFSTVVYLVGGMSTGAAKPVSTRPVEKWPAPEPWRRWCWRWGMDGWLAGGYCHQPGKSPGRPATVLLVVATKPLVGIGSCAGPRANGAERAGPSRRQRLRARSKRIGDGPNSCIGEWARPTGGGLPEHVPNPSRRGKRAAFPWGGLGLNDRCRTRLLVGAAEVGQRFSGSGSNSWPAMVVAPDSEIRARAKPGNSSTAAPW